MILDIPFSPCQQLTCLARAVSVFRFLLRALRSASCAVRCSGIGKHLNLKAHDGCHPHRVPYLNGVRYGSRGEWLDRFQKADEDAGGTKVDSWRMYVHNSSNIECQSPRFQANKGFFERDVVENTAGHSRFRYGRLEDLIRAY